jgi:hypothetical protein
LTSEQSKALLVPLLLRTKEEQLLLQSTHDGVDASTNENQDVVEAALREEMECCIVILVVNVFMLLTFGIVNSLLGFVLLVSLFVSSLWQQVLMGRFVTLALQQQQDEGKRRVEQLERACAHVVLAPLHDAAPYVMLVSSLLLACFLLDMAADTQGPLNACWAPLLLVSIVFLAWLKNKIKRDDESDASKARSMHQPKVEMADFSSLYPLACNATIVSKTV